LLTFVGPADALIRAIGGRPDRPSLRLRRHTGPLGGYETAIRDTLRIIDDLKLVPPGGCVLDIGCGPGAMTSGLLDRVGAEGSYVGFDVHRPSIEWCRRRWQRDGRCRFELARIESPYATQAGDPVDGYVFPLRDGDADFVLAKSVFTHLLPAEAERYLSEIGRTLRPGSPALLTALLFAPGSRTAMGRSRLFRGGDDSGLVRWRSDMRARSAVAYERGHFETLIRRAGLRMQWLSAGFFPGEAESLAAQEVLVIGH
jgi:SAM-dependent methyltransferase